MIDSLRKLAVAAKSLFHREQLDRDLNEELDTHIELAVQDGRRRGLNDAEARRQALIELGGAEQAREAHRDARGLPRLESLLQDLRYAARTLRREPGFTVVATLILALGIGANTAVFSLINTTLLRPLPFPHAEQLVWIAPDADTNDLSSTTYQVKILEEFRRTNRSFQSLTAYFPFFGDGDHRMTGHGEPERVSGVMVAQNFFRTLGVNPALGRFFAKEECQQNGRRAVVLSHAYWMRRFAGDARVVGRNITLDDQAVTIVGVLPAGFDFASVFAPAARIDVFTPAIFDDMRRWGNVFSVIGRLKPGETVESARAEFSVLIPRLRREHPDWWGLDDATLTGLKERTTGKLRRALLVLWAAVGLVLLLVCVNLSNLLFARTAARQKELSVRRALGAGTGRLVRQLLTESLLLATGGAILGVGISVAIVGLVARSNSLAIPLLSTMRVDGAALGFTLLLTIMTAVLFGVAPGLTIAAANLQDGLKEASRGLSSSRRHARVRRTMVVCEVALACMLLTGAGLLTRSFQKLLEVDLGFQPSRVTALNIDSNLSSGAQRAQRWREVVRQVESIPGVEQAGVTDVLPLDRNRSWNLQKKGVTYPKGHYPTSFVYVVEGGYFKAMGIPLIAGRFIDERDTAQSQPVIVINETAAKQIWPGEDPVGKTAMTGNRENRIIGVVHDVKHSGLDQTAGAEMYLPVSQAGAIGAELVIRSSLPPDALRASVRKMLHTLDPALPATDFRSLQHFVDRSVSPKRFFVVLLTVFATLAVTLATLGIYGVISYSVTERTREIGVRMALGATRGLVQAGILRGALQLVSVGIVLGALGSFYGARLIASLLFGVASHDPFTFAVMAALMIAVAIAAAYLPSRRASSIDPMIALRAD